MGPIARAPAVEHASSVQRQYRLMLVAVHLGGRERLAYGEAVEVTRRPRTEATPFSVPLAAGGTIDGSVTRTALDAAELAALEAQLGSGALQVGGQTLTTGPLVLRSELLVAPDGTAEPGATVHPDHRYTYDLTEWYDGDEALLRELWDTRVFADFGAAVAKITGLALHRASDRVGNFLRFNRRSSWYVDTMARLDAPERWIRPLHDGPPASGDLRARVHFGVRGQTVDEALITLPPGGHQVLLPQGAGDYSISLYSANTAHLLARESGRFLGSVVNTNMGFDITATLIGSDGANHHVSWTKWEHPRQPALDRASPWSERSSRRAERTRRLTERSTVHLFGPAARQEALAIIREIFRNQCEEFVYVWDPYVDATAMLDTLNWLHPDVPCKVLGGRKLPADPALVAALAQVRTLPRARRIECKLRIGNNNRAIYHDRFIITRDAAWMLGGSLNGIGLKPGGIVRLLDADRFRWMFEDEWARSPPAFQEASL